MSLCSCLIGCLFCDKDLLKNVYFLTPIMYKIVKKKSRNDNVCNDRLAISCNDRLI